ncbi:MAG: alpha-N-acetylglucosaminidase TIM-barrel domain-containing protein [Lentisphaeria bacterium]
MMKILVPQEQGIYLIAGNEFAALWQRVTGKKLSLTTSDDGKSDLIVLGSDAMNSFAHGKIVEKQIEQFGIRADSDDFQLVSLPDQGRNLLFIAAGRPRALLYGVYHFFETRAGCHYFWDGDRIPKAGTIDITGLNILEKPHFEYRGLRYFAHRSLHRFQAEHWDFEDWKKEIDWILKKRFNLFMLRIGLDDLFQKAFPECVSYPGYEVPESKERSYDDRNLFWPLQYRGELRRKILAYARERDLLHPEDVGTMTHWYSRTPLDYLEKVKPDFLPQATAGYNEETGLVWDIRQEKNLNDYFHLTETHIREYGAPTLFHTIGLAERRCYEDREANHQMKLYTYRRIIAKLREKYPHAPLLIASWDFAMYWTPEEVRSLVQELNPHNTIILDYTSETDDELRTFQNWDLVGKFPWIFGLFHAFEPNTEPRGNYEVIERRLPIAAEDPMCKGMILWPECSHTDTLLLEYLSANAWNPNSENLKISIFLKKFCAARYDQERYPAMLALWKQMLPLIKARHWNGPGNRTHFLFAEIFFRPCAYLLNLDTRQLFIHEHYYQILEKLMQSVPDIFTNLATIQPEKDEVFIWRDVLDLARTCAARTLHYGLLKMLFAFERWRNHKGPAKDVLDLLNLAETMLTLFGQLLAAHPDYSMYQSLLLLQKHPECNPDFEKTLKGNAENGYCRSYITELVNEIYRPELALAAGIIRKRIELDNHEQLLIPTDELTVDLKQIADKFYEKPLQKMAAENNKAFQNLPNTLQKLASLSKKIIV